MNTPEQPPDKKPSGIILFVIPAVIAVLFVVFSSPPPRTIVELLVNVAFVYVFAFVFLLAAWHGLRLFRNRRDDSR
jgi:hypothetical protein